MNTVNHMEAANTEQLPSGLIHHDRTNILPTASEIGNLWAVYQGENMSICMLKYMVAKSKDPDIKTVLQLALDASSQKVRSMEGLFVAIAHPMPEGFGENDVDINAPELFSENFYLSYTQVMNLYISLKYNWSLGRSSRSDFRAFFMDSMYKSTDIFQKSTDVLLAKGLLMKDPSVNIPDRIEKVNDMNYYGSFIGGKRPLNAIEISHIHHTIKIMYLLSTLHLGFSQVIKDEKIKNHVFKGCQINNEQIKNLLKFLEDEYLSIPMANFQITNSKQSPFSDKLMLFHSATVSAFTLLDTGFALSSSSRKDVVTAFNRLSLEIMEYSKDGSDNMIENGWLERVPENADRKELIQ